MKKKDHFNRTASFPDLKAALRPKRQLGQNFLADPNIVRKIIEACNITPEESVLEIGPGQGVLTRYLVEKTKNVIAVETDPRLCKLLEEQLAGQSIQIIHADFLKYNLDPLPDQLKVIGNLPYYITTPILSKLAEHRRKIKSIYITVQWELGQRIAAAFDTKEYGAFSCFVQYYLEPKILFKIKNTCFRPVPKVDSCFMQLLVREQPPERANDEKLLFQIIQFAFQQRRKTILNALSAGFEKKLLQDIFVRSGISPDKRAENLALTDFIRLSNSLG